MEIKKNKKSDLERLKGIFLQVGFVFAIGIMLIAFEWKTEAGTAEGFDAIEEVEVEEEIIPITRQEEMKKPPPPKAPQVAEVLNIVEDEVEVEEEMDIIDMEADDETVIEVVEVEEEEEEEQIFVIVEEMPQFPGGDLALRKWIANNVKYPNIARENDIQGKVFVRFCVNKNGTVDKVSIARGVDPLLDKEAIRVVKLLPKWKPGMQRGKPVNVWYTVPINFQLQ